MGKMKRFFIVLGVFVLGFMPLYAKGRGLKTAGDHLSGDMATFVDLGFNDAGTNYMFAQYGIDADTLRPWATAGIVDLATNAYIQNGRLSCVQDKAVSAGQDGSLALYHLILDNAKLIRSAGFSFKNRGRLLYLALNGDGNSDRNISFRDFEDGSKYQAILIPTVLGRGKSLVSSSYIKLNASGSRFTDGSVTYLVGNPSIKRGMIASYRLSRIISVPGKKGLVFVIETRKKISNGFDLRYMVESLEF
jgi:predicted secreted protein